MNFFKLFKRAQLLIVALSALIIMTTPFDTMAQQETPPPPAAPRSANLPKPVEKTLKNGLRVIVIERTVEQGGQPLVSAQMLLKNGGEIDPSQLPGLANITASLLTQGTQTRSATQIAEAIEALGGSLDSGAAWDASSVSLGVMSSKLNPAMEIMADVVRNPAFKDEEIERERQQTLDQLRVALKQPGSLARFVASRVVFGDSPYGHPLQGTPEAIERIKRDDIVKLHSTYYRPDNAVLIIGGDIKADAAFALADKYFGSWAKQKQNAPVSAQIVPDPSLFPPKPSKSGASQEVKMPNVVVIDKPDAGQAAVYLVRKGLRRADPDYFRGIVTNAVLNGYSGRLNQEIRIKRGLSYGASSSLDVRRGVGPFLAGAQTKNVSGAEVASLLMGELTRLSTEAVPDAELTPRKAVLIGTFGRNLETTRGLVAQIGSLALYGLNLNEINNYINNVQGVKAADIQQFAGAHLAAKESSIVIVGNAKEFLDNLRKQFPNVEVIREADLDLNSATLHKAPGGGE
jgi:zinc protease